MPANCQIDRNRSRGRTFQDAASGCHFGPPAPPVKREVRFRVWAVRSPRPGVCSGVLGSFSGRFRVSVGCSWGFGVVPESSWGRAGVFLVFVGLSGVLGSFWGRFRAAVGCSWGLGVAYDSISNQGLDFGQVPFGVQLDVDLTSDHPNAVFLFVHSRQTIVSSGGSIQVMK